MSKFIYEISQASTLKFQKCNVNKNLYCTSEIHVSYNRKANYNTSSIKCIHNFF